MISNLYKSFIPLLKSTFIFLDRMYKYGDKGYLWRVRLSAISIFFFIFS